MHESTRLASASLEIDTRLPPAAGAAGRVWSRLLASVLGLSMHETRVDRRGFQVESPLAVERIEQIGRCFASGYNQALRSHDLGQLDTFLQNLPTAESGFSFEGAAMGLALGDWMTPGRQWFLSFVRGPARHHEYMAWVGYGWALARLPVRAGATLQAFPTINKWLALDGFGFHAGYFDWRRAVRLQRLPRNWTSEQLCIFDQGLGRSLWFVFGMRSDTIRTAIDTFAPVRRADLWSGVGLAATYAGGVDASELEQLRVYAGNHAPALAQGAVFAAEARAHAGNQVPHSDASCRSWLGLDACAAAHIAGECLPESGHGAGHYQQWRHAVQAACEPYLRQTEPGPSAVARRIAPIHP